MMAKSNGTEARVQVAVRTRPLNQREIDLKSPTIVTIQNSQVFVEKPQDKHHTPKTFSYDFCFNSIHSDSSNYASQEMIFEKLGVEIVKHAFEGYNACIFAYGQTGSGKSYTMMGSHNDRGIIPRLCQLMFDQIENKIKEEINQDINIEPINNEKINDILSLKFSSSYRVEVSYFEIYNEKVRDLLNPNNNHHALKVRANKILGPYVDGLSQLVVTSYQEIETLLIEGNNYRTVASTNMNNESSRSHAVFTLKLTQTLSTDASETQSVKVSKISLVDLAGSERASKSGVQVEQARFREGCNINKSLSTLGLVISALATRQSNENSLKSTKKTFVPYRDSVLTWLLKDSLGGNSFTIMLATISPAYDNYEETISTLRYADQAKKIVNHAVINEDEPGTIIRELRDEIDKLRKELADAKAEKSAEKLNAEIKENEKLMQTISKDWQERIAETDKISKSLLITQQQKRNDPFFDVEEYNSLIGVANIFLKALFYDSKLDYLVPIINTQGEISGSLHVVLVQVGTSSMKKLSDFQPNNKPRASISEGISIETEERSLSEHSNSQNSLDDESNDDIIGTSNDKTDQITVRFAIKEVRDLPQCDGDRVMCRYTFINQKEDQKILSIQSASNDDDTEEQVGKKPRIFSFNHEKEYTFTMTDNFIATCLESAVSIEVWYHYSTIPLSINTNANNERTRRDAEIRALSNRWKEVKRHIQYAVEIHELDASGRWEPVEVDAQQPQIISGGVYRLRQGQSKRLVARLRVIPQSGTMPLVLHAIRSVEIGSINTR
ncbi:unnamed protein product, partial [Adineta steineri]